MAQVLDNIIVDAVPDVATHSVAITWANGTTTVNHFGQVIGKGVFTALIDPAVFAQVRVGERGRGLEWPDEIDFCADALWFEIHPEDAPRSAPRAVAEQPGLHPAGGAVRPDVTAGAVARRT